VLSAVEFIDAASYELVTSRGARDPLGGTRAAHYVLVELSGSDATHDEERLLPYVV